MNLVDEEVVGANASSGLHESVLGSGFCSLMLNLRLVIGIGMGEDLGEEPGDELGLKVEDLGGLDKLPGGDARVGEPEGLEKEEETCTLGVEGLGIIMGLEAYTVCPLRGP